MPAEIQAGHLFPVPRFVKEQNPQEAAERHRDLIAQALNEAAAAAFSPQVVGDTSTTTQNTTPSYVAYAGLSLSIISPVPASVLLVCLLNVRTQTWVSGNGDFEAQLKKDATVLASAQWGPTAADGREPLSLIGFATDLLPRTTYTITVEIRTSASGTNVFTVNNSASDERAVLAGVVLPRILT